MFKTLFGRGGGKDLFYRPYRRDDLNHIYNLLFCDNPALLTGAEHGSDLFAVLSSSADRETLDRIANNLDAESRTRMLAFNRLRAMNFSVPPKRLLGTIIEVPLNGGLDVLAVFPDRRIRYINHSEKYAAFEDVPSHVAAKAEEVLRVSQFVVNRYGPWTEQRRPPPKKDITRMSFLVSDGLYFGEGPYPELMRDRYAAPVINSASELLNMLVSAALEKEREDKAQD